MLSIIFVFAPFCRGIVLFEVFHRRLNATGFMWDVRLFQAHFDTGKRGNQHQIVEIAKVADAEYLVGHFGQAIPKGNVTLPFKLHNFQIIQHVLIQALNDLFYLINYLIKRNSALFTISAEFSFNTAFL